MPSRFPWGDFPDVIRNGDLGELRSQPEYLAAKSGDIDAAYTMASHLIRKEFLDSLESLASLHGTP